MIRKVFIDRQAAGYQVCQDIQERTGLPGTLVESAAPVYEYVSSFPDPVKAGKEVLFLTRNKGAFIRPCPGTQYYTCCGYMILHIGTFCVMDCSYCILQSYFHPPVLQYHVNQEEMMEALDDVFARSSIRRIGTGEFTDSLIWERIDPISEKLVKKFAGQSRAVLELKTKTAGINRLLHLEHSRKTIMAWSLNTERMVEAEEHRTAGLRARLEAAGRCQAQGYPLAFHFDPLIIYPGCLEEYMSVLERLFSSVDPSGIVWISLGSFRFMPDLKPLIQSRFPDSKIVCGEFIKGMDGKMRYFKPLRISLYRRLAEFIKQKAPETTVYFCMEDEETWRKTFGFEPAEKGGLPEMLDQAAIRHCGLSTV